MRKTPQGVGADAGPYFRGMRAGAGITLDQVAEAASISRSTLSRWERGTRTLAPVTYALVVTALADLLTSTPTTTDTTAA